MEFLEGKVLEFSNTGANVPPPEHPFSRYFCRGSPPMIRAIQAVVTDPNADQRNPKDPIRQNQVPGRDYLVVPPQECVRYLKQVLGQTQKDLERKGKMNFVQQQRMSQLEAVLRQPQERKFF